MRDILDQEDRSKERATDKLLQNIEVACTKLQQRAAFMDRQEDVRNNKLHDQLAEKYYVEGQVRIGEATSGKRQNELDQCTYTQGGQSVTVYHYFVRMGDKEPTERETSSAEAMI